MAASVLSLASSSAIAAPKKANTAPAAAQAAPVPPPPPPPVAEAAPAASTPPPAAIARTVGVSSNEYMDFVPGRYGFSFGFPDGSSPFGAGFVGARYFTEADTAVGAYLLLGNDSAAKTNAIGLAGKYSRYFAQRDRLSLLWFGQLTLGQNGGSANKGKDDFLFGFGGGLGVEFALLKNFSISGEGGIGYNTLPDSESALATGTGKLAVNFYY